MVVDRGYIKIGPEDAEEVEEILKLAEVTPWKFRYMVLGPVSGHIQDLKIYQELAKQGYDEYESYCSY
jgi:hypothetical protein